MSSLFDDDLTRGYSGQYGDSNYTGSRYNYNTPRYLDREQATFNQAEDIMSKGVFDTNYPSTYGGTNLPPSSNLPGLNIGEESFITRFERSYCSLSLRESVRLALQVNVTNLLTVIAFILLFTFVILPETDDGSQYYIWGIVLGTISYLFFVTIFRCYLG